MSDIFDRKEATGQELFIKWAEAKQDKIRYYFSPRGSAEDVQIISGTSSQRYMSEIKVREDCDLKTALRNGPYIEFPKWYSLKLKKEKIERTRKIKIDLLYINFFTDGLVIFKLNNITEAQFKWVKLPESYEDRTLIDKYVHPLFTPLEIIRYVK